MSTSASKRAGSIGAASGGFLSRRRSQARNSSLSSRSAAFRPAWKNRSRCCGLSRAQPCIVASNRSMRRISRAFEKQMQQKKLQKRKLQICGRLAVTRTRRRVLRSGGPGDRCWGSATVRASASSPRQLRPRCPLTGAKQTSRGKAATSDFDPSRTLMPSGPLEALTIAGRYTGRVISKVQPFEVVSLSRRLPP